MERVATNLRALRSPDDAVARDVALFQATFNSMREQVMYRRSLWKPV